MRQEVLILTYNQKLLLQENIDSILKNTVLPWRVSVFDDCSSDGTSELLLSYQRLHPELFFIHRNETTIGIYANMEKAFAAASGDIIHPIGGDDFFDDKFFYSIDNKFRSVKLNSETDRFIVVTSFSYFDHFSRNKNIEKRSIFSENFSPSFSDFAQDRIRHRGMGLSLALCKSFVHFQDDRYLWADRYIHLASVLNTDKVLGCPEAHSYYRTGVGVTSKVLKSKIWLSRAYVMSKFLLDFWDDRRVHVKAVYYDVLRSSVLFLIWVCLESTKKWLNN